MKLSRSLLIVLPCAGLFAQSSDLFDKAPPEVDEALRARVMILYDAYASGKFRDALKVVADDALDDFLSADKDKYKDCAISKINYTDNFTKAAVVTACKGQYRWHGNSMPVTLPLTSAWKMVDGEWFWYRPHPAEVATPWGISKVTPGAGDDSGSQAKPVMPADPNVLARQILSQVSIDRQHVELRQSELSQDDVHVTNQMQGPVTITVDKLPLPGLNAKIDQPEIPAGGKATITFVYDPKDPSISCLSCVAHAQFPAMTANIRVSPTAHVFPVKITFTSESK